MDDLLVDFRRTIESWTPRLAAIGEEESRERPTPGKWSKKEVIGHLIDSAANNHQRFVRAQFMEDLRFPGYDQEQWIAAQRYQDEPWEILVQLWRLYNLHLLHVVGGIPESTLTASRAGHSLDRIAWQAVHPDTPTTLAYLIRDYVGHLKHHLDQIIPREGLAR